MKLFSPAAFLAALFVCPAFAQTVQPIGRLDPNVQPLNTVASYGVPALNRPLIAGQDVNRAANGQPARYAIPNVVAISPTTHGTWEQLNDTWSLWRLRIKAPGADHVNLGFQTFLMPAGARMQVYTSDYRDIVRPFDSSDHQPSGQFWTPVVRSSEIVCEVYVRTALQNQMQLDLTHIGSGYRFFGAGATALTNNDGSGSCNVDVTCPQAAGWEGEISASAAISTGGSIFCSGSMINNTAQDGRNFFLTANHCGVGQGQASSLVCYWNYDAVTCGSNSAPLNQFTIGATYRAGYNASDFTLVELNSTPNAAWGVTYAGWNRAAGNATSAVAIHHPSGDSKKISFENQATQTTAYGSSNQNANANHVRVVDWDVGTTEPGSSGSPLFDQNHRIIGQLHGGGAACGNNQSDWYGRFRTSWTGGGNNNSRLSNWLDPIGTGQLTLDTLGGGITASATPYGTGCYSSFASFAETFTAGTFDLSGSSLVAINIRMTPNGTGYTINPNVPNWSNPSSPDLGLGDDDVSVQTLPFAFPYNGTTTNQVSFCSNGFVWLSNSNDADYSPTVGELAGNAARLCPVWMDLDPTSGGTCHYDIIPGGVAFTWNNIPAWTSGPSGSGNTFQIALFSNGVVDFRYRQVQNQPAQAITGYSPGFTQAPPQTNISHSMPFQVSADLVPLTWTATNRPLLGSTQFLNLQNITNPSMSIGLVVIGFTSIPNGLDLGFVGAPGCDLYTQSSVIETLYPITGPSKLWSLAIPNTPALSGSSMFTQGAVLQPPTVNTLGAQTANGVELKFGTL